MTEKSKQEEIKKLREQSPQGEDIELNTDEQVFEAMDQAFDYRGNITIEYSEGKQIVGYVFDRLEGETLRDSVIRIIPEEDNENIELRYDQIERIQFSGEDPTLKNPYLGD